MIRLAIDHCDHSVRDCDQDFHSGFGLRHGSCSPSWTSRIDQLQEMLLARHGRDPRAVRELVLCRTVTGYAGCKFRACSYPLNMTSECLVSSDVEST
jgi:hypothetical protein